MGEIATTQGTNVQSVSAPVIIKWPATTPTLSPTTTSPAAGQSVTLTATSTISLSGTGLSLEIVGPGSTVEATCSTGTTCATSVLSFKKRVPVVPGDHHRPLGSQVTSAAVSITWPATTVTISPSPATPSVGQPR